LGALKRARSRRRRAEAERKPPRSIFGAAKNRILYLAPDEELLSTDEAWDATRDEAILD
jgi:hypothetical protein